MYDLYSIYFILVTSYSMINQQLSKSGLGDIQELITNKIQEGKTVDFKQTYSLSSDPEKGEFLADISSFANTNWGDLIFWVKEEFSIPTDITGIYIEDIDKEKQKIENLIRDGIAPRVNIEMKFIELSDLWTQILIIRIAKSWSAPHRVIFTWYNKTKDQFYARNSAWKYMLDVGELRNAFVTSTTLIDKIKSFKAQRIVEIISEKTPMPLCEGWKIILHIIPTESFVPETEFDIKEMIANSSLLKPLYTNSWGHRMNLEWFVTFAKDREGFICYSYTHIYRVGIIEAVEAHLLKLNNTPSASSEKKYIPSLDYESELLKGLKTYLSALKTIGCNTPILIFLTITGAKWFEMWVDWSRFFNDYYPIDRDILSLPEYILQNYEDTPEDILRPMFDLIRNACWYPRSYNFDENGHWIGK